MRGWRILLGGLVIWAAHFFTLYGLGEFAPDTIATRIAIGALTVLCLSVELLQLRIILAHRGDRFDQWQRQIGAFGAGLGAIAILWQGLVPLF